MISKFNSGDNDDRTNRSIEFERINGNLLITAKKSQGNQTETIPITIDPDSLFALIGHLLNIQKQIKTDQL
tara:strand:+ start:362 stop:574 length:213 start_codon:yes stop_codon:yes gene_type:complete